MERDSYCIYPVYLDSKKSLRKGRKFPKNFCIDSPEHFEIQQALQQLGIIFTLDTNKRHPRDPFVFGRFMVKKEYEKKTVVQGLSDCIRNNRKKIKEASKKAAEDKVVKEVKEDPNNPLGLQPRKKKKVKSKF